MTAKSIEQVLQEYTPALLALAGVVGTAQGVKDGQPCIKVYVQEKSTALARQIPPVLEGYPVILEETGEFRALPGRGGMKV